MAKNSLGFKWTEFLGATSMSIKGYHTFQSRTYFIIIVIQNTVLNKSRRIIQCFDKKLFQLKAWLTESWASQLYRDQHDSVHELLHPALFEWWKYRHQNDDFTIFYLFWNFPMENLSYLRTKITILSHSQVNVKYLIAFNHK